MAEPAFDLRELSRRIQHRCAEDKLSLAELARTVGVSASTIRRYGDADDAEADGVLILISWLGDPPEDFMRQPTAESALLPAADGGYIRVDMAKVAALSSTVPTAGSTRTTIQRLARSAQAASVPIAALTRRTDH